MNNAESERSYVVLESSYLKERPKALLKWAKDNGLMTGIVTTPAGSQFPATQYCVELYYNAQTIEERQELLIQCYGKEETAKEEFQAALNDAYQVVCLMLAMARTRPSIWNGGMELIYKVEAAGIPLQNREINAFLAQMGDFATGPNKGNKAGLLYHNPLAVSIYAAELVTVCGSLHEQFLPSMEVPEELGKKYMQCWKETQKDTILAMLQTFCPAFLGNQAPMLRSFMGYIESSSFFEAPASQNRHSSWPGGLANHVGYVLSRLVAMVRPQTEAEMGKLVLTAVGHDLSCVGLYKGYRTVTDVDGPALQRDKNGNAQVLRDRTLLRANNTPFHFAEVQKYRMNDRRFPGHEQKSLLTLLSHFYQAVPEEMAAAIDGHKRNQEINPLCDLQMLRYPLCRYLHIADIMAILLDEEGGF